MSDQSMDEIRPELAEKLDELEILRQSLEQAKAKEQDTYDQLLRQTAEFQNFRKRSETSLSEARKAGKEAVLLQIISLADALVHAEVANQKATDVESMKKGLSMVLKQFEKFLADQGLVPIKAKGEKLDPHQHEAIARIPSAELEEGTIVDEIQRGYTLNGQIVRPARVSVATKPLETAETNLQPFDETQG
jgi:molecular chaperone GrpE